MEICRFRISFIFFAFVCFALVWGGIIGCSGEAKKASDSSTEAVAESNNKISLAEDGTTIETNTLEPTSSTISITQLPFFENSSFAANVSLTSNGTLLWFSDTGLYSKDLTSSTSSWKPAVNFESYLGQNWTKTGVGSAIQDPSDPDTIYFCAGESNSWDKDTLTKYTYLDMGGIFRSRDSLESIEEVAGNNSYWERLVVGCNSINDARWFIEPDTGIEMWLLWDRSPKFAFDDREITTSGLSKTIFHITHNKGLLKCTYDSAGESLTCDTIHGEPLACDSGTSSSPVLTGAGISYDMHYYEYDSSYLDSYASNAGDCGYIYTSGAVCDTSASDCTEEEQHKMGTTVVMDPVYQAYNKAHSVTTKTALYAGYYVQEPYWPHGGLYRIVLDGSGNVYNEEITYTDPSTGDVYHLDVRGIDCDAERTTTLTSDAAFGVLSSGEEVAQYCYVAAGIHGVFRLTTHADNTVTVSSLNDGLKTRLEYRAGCGTSCTDTIGYQYLTIDQAYVDGASYLLLISTTKGEVYFATEDFSGTITWQTLSGTESISGGGLIDVDRKQLIIAADKAPLTLPISAASSSDPEWGEIKNFYDRKGFDLAYDAVLDNVLHGTDLDGTYWELDWDENYVQIAEIYADDVRTRDVGLCYGMYYVDDITAYDTDGNGVTTATEEATLSGVFRYNSYGTKMLAGKNADGKSRLYVGGDYFGGNDGAIYSGTLNDETGSYEFAPAMGDQTCKALYRWWNASKNSCYYLCDKQDSSSALGSYAMGDLAMDPSDVDHLMLIGVKSFKGYLFESEDGGKTWTDRSAWYVYGSSSGSSMSALGNPADVLFDPQNEDVLYVLFSTYGVFKLDKSVGYFTDLTHTDGSADNVALSTTLPTYKGGTYTLGTETKDKPPPLYDLEAAVDGATGKTRLYITASPFCDAGWGYWPEQTCGTTNGGGIYSRLDDDSSSTKWDKLNNPGSATDPMQYLMAYHLAVSPVDPNYAVVAATNEFGWGSMGNIPYTTAGLFYTKDGFATLTRATDIHINVWTVAAHPSDKNKFAVSLPGGGVWELDLDTTDNAAEVDADDGDVGDIPSSGADTGGDVDDIPSSGADTGGDVDDIPGSGADTGGDVDDIPGSGADTGGDDDNGSGDSSDLGPFWWLFGTCSLHSHDSMKTFLH